MISLRLGAEGYNSGRERGQVLANLRDIELAWSDGIGI